MTTGCVINFATSNRWWFTERYLWASEDHWYLSNSSEGKRAQGSYHCPGKTVFFMQKFKSHLCDWIIMSDGHFTGQKNSYTTQRFSFTVCKSSSAQVFTFVPIQFLLLNFNPYICSALQSVALLVEMLEIWGKRGQNSWDTEVPLIYLARICLPAVCKSKIALM